MEDKNTNPIAISLIFGLIIFIIIFTFLELNYHIETADYKQHVCKEDSLRTVILQLQSDLEMEEDGWDRKETRYENVLFEYEFGLEHLKNYHPNAYRDFHRIIGYKERYSKETERDNKKRLSVKNW